MIWTRILATRVDAATTTLKFHTIGSSTPATITHADEHGNAATLSHSPFIQHHKEVKGEDGERVRIIARRTAARRSFLYPPLDKHDPLLSLDQLRYNHYLRASASSSAITGSTSGGLDNNPSTGTPPQQLAAAESEKPATASRSVTVKRVSPPPFPLGVSATPTPATATNPTVRTLKRKQPPALYVSPTIPSFADRPSTAHVSESL